MYMCVIRVFREVSIYECLIVGCDCAWACEVACGCTQCTHIDAHTTTHQQEALALARQNDGRHGAVPDGPGSHREDERGQHRGLVRRMRAEASAAREGGSGEVEGEVH